MASLFTKATSVESDLELYQISKTIISNLINQGVLSKNQIEILHRNFNGIELSDYNICYIYPDKPFSEGTEKLLLNKFKGHVIVYGEMYKPLLLTKKKEIREPRYVVTLYTI